MRVAGGNKQIAVLARQGPQGRGAGIEQRAHDLRECRLRGAMLAGEREHGIGTAIAQRRTIQATARTKSWSELTLRNGRKSSISPPRKRQRQGQHSGGAAEADRWIIDHPPAGRVDLDRRQAASQRSR